jgi:hypothetical protein
MNAMFQRNASRFAKGSGCYACNCCGRKTRAVGHGDCEHVRLCAQCYELAGYENMVQDGAKLSGSEQAHVARLVAEVKAAGGHDPDVSLFSFLKV